MGDKAKSIKYKIRLLNEGAEELEAASDGGVCECFSPKDVTSLVTRKFNEGWVFHTKRPVGDWGWELFFRKRR